MKKRLINFLVKVMGVPVVEPLFLIRMRHIEKSMIDAVNRFSFVLLSTAYDRIIWEYQFDHSKEELDLICELLRFHEHCKKLIENNLIIESMGGKLFLINQK